MARTGWLPRLLRRLHVPMLLVSSTAAAQPVGDALGAGALASFFDNAVPPLMTEHRVPGAVVAVVAGGEVLLLQGFGEARVDPARPATPDTPFATGSVAKLFVWTAVMQLVERGELDLDTDVNDYLDFEIPATFDQPITLWHLLTHTAGFEDRPMIGLFFNELGRMGSLRDALVHNLPARLRPPGVETAYSNYGSALAGYIVQTVSGLPFDVYVDRSILTPLGMTHSSLHRELPRELAAAAAVGYTPEGQSGYRAHGREYMELYPAGAMVMSAGDAAQFMMAYLGDGAGEAGRILQPATVTRMRSTLFTNLPGLPGNAYGFWEGSAHGERILGHDGDTMRFHTKLALLPERGVGFYLATNAPGGSKLRTGLWEAFLDRFYPAARAALAQEGMPMTHYAGLYGSNRVAATTAAKVVALFQNLSVQVDDDALVTVYGDERRWLPRGGGVFADAEREGAELVFRDDGGRMAVYVGDAPMEVFRRLRWFERPTFHAGLLGGASLLLLAGLIGLPLGAWRARRRGIEADVAAERTRWLAVATAGLILCGAVLFAASMADPLRPVFGAPPLMVAALAVGVVAALAVAALLMMTVFVWLLGWWGTPTRLAVSAVTLAGLAVVWQLNFWNLLGFRL